MDNLPHWLPGKHIKDPYFKEATVHIIFYNDTLGHYIFFTSSYDIPGPSN